MIHQYRNVLFLLAMLGFLSVGNAIAAGATQEITLPGKGRLVFNVPAGWQMKVLDNPANQPPMIEFDPSKGDAMRMRVVVLWTKPPDATFNTPEALRKLMQKAGEGQLFTATEQQVDLKELHGNVGAGYWYALTDRAPQAGDFQYMLHGAYPVGPLLLDFTALSRNTLRDGDKDLLGAIGSATLVPEKP
ncbi:hypothetical protein ELE36_00260 [Pseudolysobacter antarcticus]|uniref:DUF1795 domain-containing protein n=1 Tax=Pseudolysobacter antarcticus TaxID=2511995 RepID=A0A411HEL9_9GAMM|nr:hypothetical protein [Pseudolysobacter antarcticus]QBB68933.1 hypothetical protein ELE36_00260 [Pseudolysobacter antarcticus]